MRQLKVYSEWKRRLKEKDQESKRDGGYDGNGRNKRNEKGERAWM